MALRLCALSCKYNKAEADVGAEKARLSPKAMGVCAGLSACGVAGDP